MIKDDEIIKIELTRAEWQFIFFQIESLHEYLSAGAAIPLAVNDSKFYYLYHMIEKAAGYRPDAEIIAEYNRENKKD